MKLEGNIKHVYEHIVFINRVLILETLTCVPFPAPGGPSKTALMP